MTMRYALPLLLLLAGCQTAREAAAMYQRAADKGIEFSTGEATPPAAEQQQLPGGLVGDTANRAYTTDTQKPQ